MTKFHLIFDIESRATTEAHQRYQAMERYVPKPGTADSGRRGQRRDADPLTVPRWPFQEIVTAVAMKCIEHADGGIEPIEFVTLSMPDLDERAIIQGLFALIASMPAEKSELVTFGGAHHDLPLLAVRAMRHGLTLPKGWGWMAFGSQGKVPHLDLLRVMTGGFKLKAVHMAELAAVFDVPAKVSDAAWSAARHIDAGRWNTVQSMAECDVATTAMLFASWRTLLDDRCPVDTAHDRICRKVEELRPGRDYVYAFTNKREQLFRRQIAAAEFKLQSCGGAYSM